MSTKAFTLLFIGLIIGIGILFSIFGSDEILHMFWNTPTIHPIFADIRTITGANETLAQGLDPLVVNPGDPWNRTMNYPRIWQYIAESIHFSQSTTIYFGVMNISLFIVGFLLLVYKIKLSRLSSIVLLLAFFSPASALAMERGNIDMVMFFLLSLALFYISRPIVFSGIILFASFLKIFPIFALSGLLREHKSLFLKVFLVSTIMFFGYVLLTINDILLIKNGTPQSSNLSYGINVIPLAFEGTILKILTQIGSYVYVVFLIVFIAYYLRKNKSLSVSRLSIEYIDAFRIGSAIYLMTFLLGTSWDYRLIFLIFTIPQLILWTKSKIKIIKLSALLVITCILLTMWYLDIKIVLGKLAWILDESSNWVLFSFLLFLFIVSLPIWVFELLKLKTDNDPISEKTEGMDLPV